MSLLTSTEELLNEGARSIMFTTVRPEVVMERGSGIYLWDTTGKRYLDFMGGWAVICLGHCPPVITKALEAQSRQLVNASPAFYNRPMLQLAKLLTDCSCFDRVFFGSSGAEANEGAIKLARKYGSLYRDGAYEIITISNSFHGRTLATMSATGKKKWEALFEPKVPGFKHVPLNDFAALSEAVSPRTCAIMLEPIQGEGGVFESEGAYIKSVRKLCDDEGLVLVFDEVQTGLGRTGKMFAYEHYGIEPDVMTLAKGIGGGFPLSALLAKEKYNVFEAGDQGGTYSGQPLAMAVGLAVVNEIIEKDLVTNAQIQGTFLMNRLNQLKSEFGIKNVRGKGLLVAFDLAADKGSEVVSESLKAGLILNSPQPETIRLMPPLIVTEKEIDEMIHILSTVLRRVI